MIYSYRWLQQIEWPVTLHGKAWKSAIALSAILVMAFLVWPAAAYAQKSVYNENIVFSNDVYFPPYVFLDEGKPTGFAVELIQNLGKVTGQHVDVRLQPWKDVLPELRTGKIDITSANISRERLKEFDFSVPIAEVHYILFVRKGTRIRNMGDARGKALIVHSGDITHEFLKTSHLASRIVTVAANDDGLRLLSSGLHDAAFAPKLQGLYFIKKYRLNNIEPTDAGLPPMEYAFAVKKGNSALLRSINEGLGILKENGTYRRLYNKWFGVYEEQGLYYKLRYYIYASTLASVLFILSFIWSWSLRRQVRVRTTALTEEVQHRAVAEEALRDTNQKLRTLIQASPLAILTLDVEGNTTMWNPAAEHIFGWSEEEVLGRISPAIPKEKLDEFNMTRCKVLQGEVLMEIEAQRSRRDGTMLDVSISAAPLYDATGNVYGFLAIIADITEQKRAAEHKKEFYQKTILAATNGKLVITDLSEIKRISGPAIATLEINTAEDLGKIRAAAEKFARDAGMDENRIYDFVLCIGEATTNVCKHVGTGSASMHRHGDSLVFVTSDTGSGINAINLPAVALKRSYTTAVSLGIGYKAMISIADQIYLSTGPTGTTVAIEMSLQKQEAIPALAGLPDTWTNP